MFQLTLITSKENMLSNFVPSRHRSLCELRCEMNFNAVLHILFGMFLTV